MRYQTAPCPVIAASDACYQVGRTLPSSRIGPWEQDLEAGSGTLHRFHLQGSIEHLAQALDDGKAYSLAGLLRARPGRHALRRRRIVSRPADRAGHFRGGSGLRLERLREGGRGVRVQPGTGVRDAQEPALLIARVAASPAHRDAALPRELDRIQDQILRDATYLDGVALGREALGAFTAQEQAALLRQRPDSFAQLGHDRRDVDRLDPPRFAPRLQARKTRHVVEQMMERVHIAHENAHELIPGGFAKPRMTQPGRRIGNDAEIASQVMGRLAPQVRALRLEIANLLHRLVEVAHLTGGLALLQLEVLSHALLDAGARHGGPYAPRHGHRNRRYFGVRDRERIHLGHQAVVQLAELARHLAQVVPLAPALQAMRGARLLRGALQIGGSRRGEDLLESAEDRGNVIEELHARQGIAALQRRVALYGLPPGLEDLVAPALQVLPQCGKIALNISHYYPWLWPMKLL